MKIFLRILLIALGVFVLAILIMGLTGPKTYQIDRTAVIAASPNVVWPYTSSAKAFQEWSPFRKMDTTATVEFFGDEGTVGSGFKWEGKKAGKGELTYTALEPGKTSLSHLKFYTPFGSMESDAYMNIEPDPAGTKLTWGFKGENNFLWRVMMSMGNMDKQMGPVFEEGLTDLQNLISSRSSSVPTSEYEIGVGDYPGGQYLGVRGDIKMSDIGPFYEKNLPAVMGAVQKEGFQMESMPLGLYFTWDEEKQMTNMLAGIGVKGDVKAPAGMEVVTIAPGKAAMMKYTGGYSGLGNAHLAMDNYFKSNNLQQMAPVIEEYVTDPGIVRDSNQWVTKITYLIKNQ